MLPTVTIDLPFLAREVNDAHSQVQYHAKGMLLEAKRAGVSVPGEYSTEGAGEISPV